MQPLYVLVVVCKYIRLFKGTNGGLSTSNHQKDKWVCGFDIVTTPNMKGGDKLKPWLDNYFVSQLKAKVHWGKNQPDQIDYANMYGANYQEFLNTVKAWYASHGLDLKQSMLVNGFISQLLGLSAPANDASFAQESLIREEPQAIVGNILGVIEGDDIYANQLRDKLLNITATPIKHNKNQFFKSFSTSYEPVAFTQPENKRRRV